MKRVGFFNQLRNHRFLIVNGIVQKVGNIPICRSCNKPIEVMEIKEMGPNPEAPTWMEIYAKCHGKEDYARLEFPVPCHPSMWGTAISTGNFFDPSHEDDSAVRS